MKDLKKPNYIFKFQECGKFLNQSLQHNTIFFSSIENFNDPFETMFSINSWNNHELGEDYFYERIFPYTALARIKKEYHHSIIQTSRQSPGKDILLQEDLRLSILAMIRDLFGVACFSSSYDELLMWSHYAGSGKGVCLIFDREQLFNRNTDGYPQIEEVNYQDKLPSIDIRLSEDKINFNLIPLITTKRHNWSYEKEVRAFINMAKITSEISLSSALLNGKDKRLRNLKFNAEKLKGIIFGHNCNIRNRNKIKKILQANTAIDFDKLLFVEAKVDSRSGQYYFRKETN